MSDPAACIRFRRWWAWQILLDLGIDNAVDAGVEIADTIQEDDSIVVDPDIAGPSQRASWQRLGP